MRKLSLLLVPVLVACAAQRNTLEVEPSWATYVTAVHKDLITLPPPKEKIIAACYSFRDLTGQYKPGVAGANFSSAVTRGATPMLVKALDDSGWFILVEREGLANLLQERKLVRSTEMQHNIEKSVLPPLLYAGVLLEGGIISYESNVVTGGMGAKYFGLGGFTNVRKDQVTVYLRATSTKTGRILTSVSSTKSILSKEVHSGVYRFVKIKRLLEIEGGVTENQPVGLCVLEAIEQAVIDLIKDGIYHGLWKLKNPGDYKELDVDGVI